MYGGLNKEGGGIVGQGLLTKDFTGQFVDLSDAAANASAEESLVCLHQDLDKEEWTEIVVTSFVDVDSGEVGWHQAENAEDIYRRTICMSQMSSMLHDADRNGVYEKAIKACINAFTKKYQRPPLVLDIGAGTGLLSMLAARHGAEQVIGCEMFGHMADIASQIVASNEMDDRVQIITAKSTEIDTESFAADILVSELLDTVLLGEGCIPSHMDAIQRGLLANQILADEHVENIENRIIPNSAEVFACLIRSEEIDAMNSVGSIELSGLDMDKGGASTSSSSSAAAAAFSTFRDDSAMKCEGTKRAIPIQWKEFFDRGKSIVLTESKSVLNVNFFTAPTEVDTQIHKKNTYLHVKDGGQANAVLFWWKVYLLSPELDPSRSLHYSTEPGIQRWQDHWVQALYPLPTPVNCIQGEDVLLTCYRDSLQVWFDARITLSNSIESKKRPFFEDLKESTANDSAKHKLLTPYSLPCSCGWHLLCDADRLSALNDLERMSKYRCALKHSLCQLKDCNVVSVANTASGRGANPPMVISLDVSDGSSLAFILASTLKDNANTGASSKYCDLFRVVSMERKQFSRILSMQLMSANDLNTYLGIWDGTDISDIPYLFSDESNNDASDTNMGKDDEESKHTCQNVKVGMLICEDNFYQLRALPVAQAISFFYMRRSLDHMLLPNAPIIPQRAMVMIAAVELPDLSTSNGLLGKVCGFDHQPLDSVRESWHTYTFPYKMSQYRKKFLTKPTEVHVFEYQDFNSANDCHYSTLNIPFNTNGRSDAVLIWVDYQLAPGINLLSLDADVDTNRFDFKDYLKSGVRFFQQAMDVTSSSSLEVEVSFKVGDSDVSLQFAIT